MPFFYQGQAEAENLSHKQFVTSVLEQNTDVVMANTSDSYEGICSYFGGTYISYQESYFHEPL